MIKKVFNKIPSWILYFAPIFIISFIALLAYFPGVMVSDSMVQWNQIQTGQFDNWHPAYNTIYMTLLSKIWNSPFFILLVQCAFMGFAISYSLTRLEKYFNINKVFLFITSCIFAMIPLNVNYAITFLKDINYSLLIMMLTAFTIDMIKDKEYFKRKRNYVTLTLVLLLLSLFRHNGIIVVILMLTVLIIIFRKKMLLITAGAWLVLYIIFMGPLFNALDIVVNNYSNKYGVVSHVVAKLLNSPNVEFTEEELEELSNYVDVEKLKNNFDQYNMDYSIHAQKIDYIKEHGNEYIKFGLKKSFEYPFEVITHYIKTTSFIYSPLPFPDAGSFAMHTYSDLWVYEDKYPEQNLDSKIPWAYDKFKGVFDFWQSKPLKVLTTRPALWMYTSILSLFLLTRKYKNKLLWIIILPSILNLLSLSIAMPVHLTRYVYPTFLVFFVIVPWYIYKQFINKKVDVENK